MTPGARTRGRCWIAPGVTHRRTERIVEGRRGNRAVKPLRPNGSQFPTTCRVCRGSTPRMVFFVLVLACVRRWSEWVCDYGKANGEVGFYLSVFCFFGEYRWDRLLLVLRPMGFPFKAGGFPTCPRVYCVRFGELCGRSPHIRHY